jgi:hypothetical protein
MTRLRAVRDLMTSSPAAVAVAVALIVLGVVLIPSPSTADAISPLDLLPGGGGLPLPSLNPASWAVDAFKALLDFMFGDQIDALGKSLVNILLAVPLLTDKRAFPQLNEYRTYVTGAAWGLLALSFVVSSLRYWLSSYSGSGAYEALQGFVRTVGAIALLMLFPIVFDQLSRAVNALTVALAVNPIVGHGLGDGLAGTMTVYSGGGFGMLFALAAIAMAVVLIVVKVIVIALLAVLFVASPLAIALWPIEETSWLMTSLIQAVLALLMFPVVWALCFGTFAVLNVDAMFPGNDGDILNTVLSPAITVAALVVAFRLPFKVLEQGLQAGISPRFSSGIGHVQAAASLVRR